MALTQITTGSIADDAVTTDKLANAINTARDANTAKTTNATHSGEVTGATALTIADNVVDEANLKVSNSPTNGYFLSAQSGNTGGLTWAQVSTDLSNDSSPQLGGNLASNGNDILMADSDSIKLGTGNDLLIYHDGSNSYVQDNGTGDLFLQSQSTVRIKSADEDAIKCIANGTVELYHDNTKKFETESSGTRTTGDHNVSGEIHLTTDGQSLKIGAGADLRIKHNGTDNIIDSVNGDLLFAHSNTNKCQLTGGAFRPTSNGNIDLGTPSYRWQGIYTSDLHLSNEAKGVNDVDGTWGSFTIQEGAESLFLINRRNGKKYKFNLTEVS